MITARLQLRKPDKHGSGEWQASRGARKHNGIDYSCAEGSVILTPVKGYITKLGYPYGDDLSFRYVQVTDEFENDHRFFYIEPSVQKDEFVMVGDEIGVMQNLIARYPGINNHVHYEVKHLGEYLNPDELGDNS